MRSTGFITLLSSLSLLLVLHIEGTPVVMPDKVPTKDLGNGAHMPVIGYGTWQAQDEEVEKALDLALEAGYRHIDTALVYENEKVIGKVLKKWFDSGKITRKDIFLVTKLPPSGHRAESVPKFLKQSLENLQLDYVDLYLVHTPFGFQDVAGDLHPMKDGKIQLDLTTDHVATWKAMEAQVEAGLAKTIGISNFNQSQIQRILDNSKIKPAALQVELHAYHQQNGLVEYCKKNNIVVTAYSPLGSPGIGKIFEKFGSKIEVPDILGNPVVEKIAKKHSKTNAQVLLRHAVQKGITAIPKSTNAERLRQNLDIFNFELDAEDMKELNGLNKDLRIVDFTIFKGITDHPEYPFQKQ